MLIAVYVSIRPQLKQNESKNEESRFYVIKNNSHLNNNKNKVKNNKTADQISTAATPKFNQNIQIRFKLLSISIDPLRQTLDSGSLEDPGEFLTPSSSAFWCLIGENSDERKKEDAHGEQLKTQVVLSPSIQLVVDMVSNMKYMHLCPIRGSHG